MPHPVSGEGPDSTSETSPWCYILGDRGHVCVAERSDGMKKDKGREVKSFAKPISDAVNPDMGRAPVT